MSNRLTTQHRPVPKITSLKQRSDLTRLTSERSAWRMDCRRASLELERTFGDY